MRVQEINNSDCSGPRKVGKLESDYFILTLN
jgi:hypothetical protein